MLWLKEIVCVCRFFRFFYAGIYVYSRLIRVKQPLTCQFRISPSSQFKPIQFAKRIDLSINRHKAAQESISITQLEAITSHLLGIPFVYSEDIIIDDTFTIEDLPDTVNGDALYQTNRYLLGLLTTPSNFKRYELRYINPIYR